jgi:hypothetical protein
MHQSAQSGAGDGDVKLKDMATDAVMYVYMEEYRDEKTMTSLASELMQQFDLSEGDFPCGGPLVYMPQEDYDLAHVEGKPGFLLNVNLWRSYYYVGYERGDLTLFVNVAEWLEQRLFGCRVFYGHDGSDEGSPFDAAVRTALRTYRNKVGFDLYSRKDLSHEQKQELRAQHSQDVPVMGRS